MKKENLVQQETPTRQINFNLKMYPRERATSNNFILCQRQDVVAFDKIKSKLLFSKCL